MKNLPTHKKWILFITLLITLGIAAPVLADYLGPNRTVTTTVSVCKVVLKECQYVEAKGDYRYHQTEDWSCSSESKPWQAYPSNSRPCNASNKGYEYWSREESSQQTTVTYDPATISGSIQNCTLQNGWCVSPADLALSANEPLAGYNITLIEGTLNGASFTCSNGATSCSVPLNEGDNDFAYWAHSTWDDTSSMGRSFARVDTIAPSVGLDIQGTPGALNWWISAILVTPTGSDATSGVASALLSIDGGATWQPSLTLNEGVYNAVVTVADYAGNVSNSSAPLSVDTTTPAINMSVAGTLGKNSWYKSAIQVTAAASDATSGVATFDVSADGTAYQTYTPIAFNDGLHTIRFRACDTAGNCTETASQAFYVDTLAPTVNLPASWQLGTNVPYDVIDEGSGLAALRIVIEDEDEKYAKVAWNQEVSGSTYSQDIDWNGEFKDKTVAPPGTYLVWIKASDVAGNERFQLGKVIVPETNLFLNLLPTEAPVVSAQPPAPPAELFEPEDAASPTTPPAADSAGAAPGGTGTTTYSFTSTSGTAGGSAGTSSGLLGGGTAGTGAQTSMPWLPITAAAALGTSAVVASRTEAGKVKQDKQERLPHRFPENPIPFSLFPKSPGSGKAVASYKLDDPPPTPPPTPPEEGDEGDTGVVATSTPIAPGGPQVVPIRAPIAPGTPPIKPIVVPKIPEEVLLEAGGVGTNAANAMSDYDDLHQQRGIERIAALIDNAKSFSLKSAFSNLLNEEWVAGKLEKTLVQTAEKLTPQALIDDVNLWAGGKIPFGEVASNLAVNTLKRVDDGLNRGSIATALMSIAGTTMSALGIKQGETVSDIGTVGGAIVDLGSVGTGIGKLIVALKSGAALPTAGTLGKVAGVLAIPVGAYIAYTEGSKVVDDLKDDGELSQAGKASAWNAAGGVLTAFGGVAMLIPGGQIVGGILLAAGGVCSGVAWCVQNQDKIRAFRDNVKTSFNNTVTTIKNKINEAATAVKETVKKTVDTVKTKIAETVTNVTDKAAKAITVVGQNISKAVTKFTETAAKTVKVIGEKVAAAVTKVTETASKAVTNVTSTVAKLVNKVSPAAAEKIVQAGQAVSKAVRDAGQAVAKTVTKAAETASKAISNAGQKVAQTVNSATQKAAETVKSIGNTISNWFKKKP